MKESTRRKLRVAVITDYFPTSVQPWAGHSAYQTLLELAHRCEIEVFYPESVYPKMLTPRSRTYSSMDRTYEPPGIKTHYLPFWAMPVISRPLNGWLAARAIRRSVAAYQPDVILSYIVYPAGFAAVRVGRHIGVPAVLTAIGSDLNRISGSVVRRMTRYALRHAAGVVTVSRDLLRTALMLGARADRSVAILNGCDTKKFRPRDRIAARGMLDVPLQQEIVLYVGRLDLRKGLIELVEAVALLRQRRPKVHCYIVGEGSDRTVLNDCVARCGMESHITFVPSCATERVATWIAASDLLTLPSYKEGCPNVILESLCSGRPVVATDVGGIPELMDEASGKLVKPKNVEELSRALDEVLSRRWNADSLADKHHRSWQDVSDDLYEVLARAADSNS
ncbi:glycosyltransferase [Terriglobus roseus DSM 18391]|uniref:Glycosyltransferase n=1 Tax=Terriglobus roseus (strain DSM 18391 / NRRL B-41598 / KBS 63) TaxID=926566 RepID=I3ZIK0_TERRK|nr:glycosyltransferase [Terriglobus roseus]AFL89068.1 glycosyltransferase [Terriglobus roseus DSM 18391]